MEESNGGVMRKSEGSYEGKCEVCFGNAKEMFRKTKER